MATTRARPSATASRRRRGHDPWRRERGRPRPRRGDAADTNESRQQTRRGDRSFLPAAALLTAGPVKNLVSDINNHVPARAADRDGDLHATSPILRGSAWRGRDCDDADADVRPGRRPIAGDASVVDSNCNGIFGVDEKGDPYETTLCGDPSDNRGVVVRAAGRQSTAYPRRCRGSADGPRRRRGAPRPASVRGRAASTPPPAPTCVGRMDAAPPRALIRLLLTPRQQIVRGPPRRSSATPARRISP